MKRWNYRFAVWSVVVASSRCFAADSPPVLQGDSELPEPPQQKASWTRPRCGLPEQLVSATAKLFEQGLADPRGCEYREIRLLVRCDNCSGCTCDPLTTHGWVLPDTGQGRRFAVGWNGLVTPVLMIGPAADLRRDVAAIVAADIANRAKEGEDKPNFRFRRDVDDNWHDEYELSVKSLHPLKTCLLLRLGETDLAIQCWNMWTIGTDFAKTDQPANNYYVMLGTWWTEALAGESVGAHIRCNDDLALAAARKFAAAKSAVEAECARLNLKVTLSRCSATLVADQERRFALRKSGYVPPQWALLPAAELNPRKALAKDLAAHLKKFPDQKKRIAEEIRLLEECNDDTNFNPFADALIAEGGAAVEPLLDCLENDRRLSRNARGHVVSPVAEFAFHALERICKTEFDYSRILVADSPEDLAMRKSAAGKFRAYWKNVKGLSLEESWYRVLADDNSPAEKWLDAAKNITLHSNQSGDYFSATSDVRPKPDQRPTLHGDSLRDGRRPSVTDLMVRRIDTLAARKPPSDFSVEVPPQHACTLASYLAEWDAKAAMPVLRRLTGQCEALLASHSMHFPIYASAESYIADFTIRRHAAGDRQALDEYAAWVRGAPPRSCVHDLLTPLWRLPNEKATRELAQHLFAYPNSPWFGPRRSPEMTSFFQAPLIHGNLVTVPAFRNLLLTLLADRTVIGDVYNDNGTVRARGNGQFPWDAIALVEDYGTWDSADPRCPPKGTVVRVRRCDVIAADFWHLEGMRDLRLYWPLRDRDRAVAACADVMRRYGQFYVADDSFGPDFAKPKLILPPLDHAATAGDVGQGLAIFTLVGQSGAGQGEVRRVEIARLPKLAKWTTYKEERPNGMEIDPTTGDFTKDRYNQRGRVWQAEEIRIGGKWQRYFGFVGAGGVSKVPAAEIEFYRPFEWTQIDESCAAGLLWSGVARDDSNMTIGMIPVHVGDPIMVRLAVKNCKGSDSALPRFYDAAGPKPPSGQIAVHTSVSYTPEVVDCQEYTTEYALRLASKLAWTELERKRRDPLPFAPADGKLLGPAETADALAFDLAKWYPADKPGTYHVRLEFDRSGQGCNLLDIVMPVFRKGEKPRALSGKGFYE
jgi:hypothetical protein